MRPLTLAHLVIAFGLFVLAAFPTVGTFLNLWPDPPVATIAFISGLPISAGLAWLVLEARRGLPFSKALRSGWAISTIGGSCLQLRSRLLNLAHDGLGAAGIGD